MKIHIHVVAVALFMSGMNTANADTVKIDLPAVSTYPTISDAYTAAADGATIMLQATVFFEKLNFGASKSVFLSGGYDSGFAANAGDSTVRGTITVSKGSVRVENIVIGAADTVPDAPTGVSATAGSSPNSVIVSFGATTSSGSPITGYTVTSIPAGITADGSASPITVTCPSSCTGYAFSVVAGNVAGNSAPSAPADVVTNYNIVETFFEPETQPSDSIFIGSFTFNSTTGTVSNLHGILSESMTGGQTAYPNDAMTWLQLNNQLSSVPVTLGGVNGLLVTTFFLNDTDTFSNNPDYGGTDGWSPGTGSGLYYGCPTSVTGIPNPGNAYARIFVNTTNPTAALTQAQIDKLAYADCAAGGMMGATCMTGTTVAGYGSLGTMDGYPQSQVITKQ